MNCIYSFFVSFIIIFFAELGDKTQLLVLSFSTKTKTKNIILGIALGSFLSHGLAIIFGSKISLLFSESSTMYLKLFSSLSFILLGIIGFIFEVAHFSNINKKSNTNTLEDKIMHILSKLKLPSWILLAFLILIGELGDKTFLSSLTLASNYPTFKIFLILGATLGMIISNSIALFFGKFISLHFNYTVIKFLSNLIFIVFGIIELILP